jgi:uncharacterized protein YqeY
MGAAGANQDVRSRLQRALTAAMKERRRSATSAYRTTLAALASAEAVPPVDAVGFGEHVAGAAAGVRVMDVDRRILRDEELIAIVEGEIAGHRNAAAMLGRAGRRAEAAAQRT